MTLVPLAEHFHSLQGEGAWQGLPMHFLRFPGCSVGRSASTQQGSLIPILQSGALAKQCCDFSGQHFWCDTDFDSHGNEYLERLVSETFEHTVCFSGGEPLIHQDSPWYHELLKAFQRASVDIHIETSGTILPLDDYDFLTVSPKKGWRYDVIALADQVKFLITKDTDLDLIDEIAVCAKPKCQFFLSPVFDPNSLVRDNVDRCVYLLQHRYRDWRLSVQVHKWLELP